MDDIEIGSRIHLLNDPKLGVVAVTARAFATSDLIVAEHPLLTWIAHDTDDLLRSFSDLAPEGRKQVEALYAPAVGDPDFVAWGGVRRVVVMAGLDTDGKYCQGEPLWVAAIALFNGHLNSGRAAVQSTCVMTVNQAGRPPPRGPDENKSTLYHGGAS